jgi:geranylgeranyl pyrophosphate synthase
MWQQRQTELLKREIDEILSPLCNNTGLFEILKEPLAKAARGLNSESQVSPWPLLPMMVCEAISADYERAIPAAASLQLFMASGDVFDDVEDADSPESLAAKYGNAVATNAATTLLILAEQSLTRLKQKRVEDALIVRIMAAVNSFYTTACAGQHMDITLLKGKVPSEESYLKIIGMKSASQIECACHIGALLASTGSGLVEIFSAFGYNLGMAAQITNDIRGITGGKDILKPKLTLPIIYALTHADNQVKPQLEKIFLEKPGSIGNAALVKDLIFRSGAVHYSVVQMELYKQKALDFLSESEKKGVTTEQIRVFFN